MSVSNDKEHRQYVLQCINSLNDKICELKHKNADVIINLQPITFTEAEYELGGLEIFVPLIAHYYYDIKICINLLCNEQPINGAGILIRNELDHEIIFTKPLTFGAEELSTSVYTMFQHISDLNGLPLLFRAFTSNGTITITSIHISFKIHNGVCPHLNTQLKVIELDAIVGDNFPLLIEKPVIVRGWLETDKIKTTELEADMAEIDKLRVTNLEVEGGIEIDQVNIDNIEATTVTTETLTVTSDAILNLASADELDVNIIRSRDGDHVTFESAINVSNIDNNGSPIDIGEILRVNQIETLNSGNVQFNSPVSVATLQNNGGTSIAINEDITMTEDANIYINNGWIEFEQAAVPNVPSGITRNFVWYNKGAADGKGDIIATINDVDFSMTGRYRREIDIIPTFSNDDVTDLPVISATYLNLEPGLYELELSGQSQAGPIPLNAMVIDMNVSWDGGASTLNPPDITVAFDMPSLYQTFYRRFYVTVLTLDDMDITVTGRLLLPSASSGTIVHGLLTLTMMYPEH